MVPILYNSIYLVLLINNRKKVLTDPRLSKSKSPLSSSNRWYTGGDDEAETTASLWYGGGAGHLYLTATNELSPPTVGHDDASSVSMSMFY